MAMKKSGKQNTLIIKFLKFPIWLLSQALTVSGGQVTYGNTMGCPTPLPRSLSTKSNGSNNEEQFKDLIRVSSTRKTEAELYRSKSTPMGSGGGGGAPSVVRSKTMAIGRIDEDRAFEYGGDDDVGLLLKSNVRSRNRGGHGFTRMVK